MTQARVQLDLDDREVLAMELVRVDEYVSTTDTTCEIVPLLRDTSIWYRRLLRECLKSEGIAVHLFRDWEDRCIREFAYLPTESTVDQYKWVEWLPIAEPYLTVAFDQLRLILEIPMSGKGAHFLVRFARELRACYCEFTTPDDFVVYLTHMRPPINIKESSAQD